MKFNCFTFLICSIPITALTDVQTNQDQDYHAYHKQIIQAEILLGDENFTEALNIYNQVFKAYDFIFIKDCQIAAQLALYLEERHRAFQYIKEGIAKGWKLEELKKNKFLARLQGAPEWKGIEQEYDSLHHQYLESIDPTIREEVHSMFKKDQKKALGALFRIGKKAQERYALKKFVPHSETQITKLIIILEKHDYPGEQLIGNNFWMSTIVSHHNSITQEYVQKDTLYRFIRPMLIRAIGKGQISPYEFALIDDWQKAVSSNRTQPGYGFLNPPHQSTLSETNGLRKAIGLRSVELRNKLIDVENRTGMDFYLPDWVKGKITIEQN